MLKKNTFCVYVKRYYFPHLQLVSKVPSNSKNFCDLHTSFPQRGKIHSHFVWVEIATLSMRRSVLSMRRQPGLLESAVGTWDTDLKGRDKCILGPSLWETEKISEHVESWKVERGIEREREKDVRQP